MKHPHTLELLCNLWRVRVLVRVQLDGHFPVRLLDLLLAGILLHTQNLVVVFPLALLELEFCVADVLLECGVGWVGLGSSLELAYGLLPFAGLLICLGKGFAGLGEGRVQLERLLAVGDGFSVLLELWLGG